MIRNDRSTESGSTLVVSALLLVAILGAAALAIDVGVFYTARAQCQNSADSGALACAGHMLTFTQLNNGAIPQLKAKGVEYSNYHSILTDAVTIGPGDVVPDLANNTCRVCVSRTQANGNPVPTFFGRIFNVFDVDIWTCATAEVGDAVSSSCLKPWALPDAYDDLNNSGGYDTGDYYQANVTSYGTDYRSNGNDIGYQMTVKQANPNASIASGQFFPIDLPLPDGPDTGGDKYRSNIVSCNGTSVSIGDDLYTENGNMIGPTKQGVLDLIDLDPGAYWDTSTNTVANSAFGPSGSPRLIRIPFFDPGYPPTSGKVTVKVTNIASLFLEGIDSQGVVTARIAPATGMQAGNSPGLLKFVRLIE